MMRRKKHKEKNVQFAFNLVPSPCELFMLAMPRDQGWEQLFTKLSLYYYAPPLNVVVSFAH